MKRTVLFLVNHDVVIYNFRRELVEELIAHGYQVVISCPYGPRIDDLIRLGCRHVNADINRHGLNLLQDIGLLKEYMKLMHHVEPSVVLTYTIKPNIYGSIAASKLKIPYIVNITGLGSALESGGILSRILYKVYGFSTKNAHRIFFQNQENQKAFLRHGIGAGKNTLISGSGVNLQQFLYVEYPLNVKPIIFTFIGRLMKDKGIWEFIQAAEMIKSSLANVEFRCIGFVDDSDEMLMKSLRKVCKYFEFTPDIRPYIEATHAVVLPSYHEGMSNVLLEAAAMGRPIIASNVPGCKETFEEGITGYGCEARDAESLARAMMKFIETPHERKREMGIAGRRKMEREFDRNIIVDAYMKAIIEINEGGKLL